MLSRETEERGDDDECFDCSLSGNGELDEDDEFDDSELFEINLNTNIKDDEAPLDTIIEEEEEECGSSVFSLDIHNWKEEDAAGAVYVAVGHHGDHILHSSMAALSWALKHAATTLYLLHVFPLIKLIPTPLGKIPRSHVNLEHVNHYLNQRKGNTKLLLQKFIDLCVDSRVKVEMILIEGDNVAEAIVELVVKHDIRRLVIGTTASNLTRESGYRRGNNGTANKVLKNVPESCDVKIICEGRVVLDGIGYNSSSSSRSKDSNGSSSQADEADEPPRAVAPLMRFMAYPIWLFRPRLSSPR